MNVTDALFTELLEQIYNDISDKTQRGFEIKKALIHAFFLGQTINL